MASSPRAPSEPMQMGKIELDYLVRDVDRYGKVRFYVRRKGHRKIRIHGQQGSPEFMAAYYAALGQTSGNMPVSRGGEPPRGSLRAACIAYFASPEFNKLDARTRRIRRSILDGICRERGAFSGQEYGPSPIASMKARHVFTVRDARSDQPEAANARLKALRQVFVFAMRDHETFKLETNPARDVPYLSNENTEGFRAWEADHITRFEAVHPVGTKARLALGLLLFTGQRRSDVVLLGRQHVRNGHHGPTLRFTQQKNRKRKPVTLEIPIVPELQAILDASPCGDLTFLVTEFGKGFTANGFGNRFRRWCDEAGTAWPISAWVA